MEKEGGTGSGFNVLDKKSSSNSGFVSSMKLHNGTGVFPSKISMTGRSNLDRPFVGGDDDVDGGGGTTGSRPAGPTNNSGGANDALGNIYRVDVLSSGGGGGGGGGGGNFARTTSLQPFDNFPPSYSSFPYKSPGGEMGFPFTAAQWKELERQAMIYKFMVSSVPVPPHLLLPLSRNFSATAAAVDSSASSIYGGRFSRNGDPEPGRCKRTDGKKWRCAREVAPHQKYCERHLHRGRPRSRKPVEVKSNGENHKKSRLEHTKSLPTVQSNSASSQQFPPNDPLLFANAKTDLSISTPYYKATNRDLGLTTTEGEMVSSEPPWENMMEANMGLENCYFPQQYVEHIEPLNLFSYPNFPAPEIDLPSGFIDAWSIDNLNSRNNVNMEPSISLNEGDLSPSLNLSMAMAAGNIVDQEMRNIQTGDDVKDCDGHKTKDSLWRNPVSWEPFARGGPLGEALQPVGSSNPSTPATTVSSPSGVLHWTLFSHSDSSVCNSPTFVAQASEVSNQWHN